MIEHYAHRLGPVFGKQLLHNLVSTLFDGATVVQLYKGNGAGVAFLGVELANSGRIVTHDLIDPCGASGPGYVGDEIDARVEEVESVGLVVAPLVKAGHKVRLVVEHPAEATPYFLERCAELVWVETAGLCETELRRAVQCWLSRVKVGGYMGGTQASLPHVEAVVRGTFGGELEVGGKDEGMPVWVWRRRAA